MERFGNTPGTTFDLLDGDFPGVVVVDGNGDQAGTTANPFAVLGAVPRARKGAQFTTMTSSTAETTIVTADATYKLDVYGLIVTNTSATGCEVVVRDSTAGTVRLSVYVPPTETRGFMLPASDGHRQAAANANWTATCGTSVASIKVTALFAQNL